MIDLLTVSHCPPHRHNLKNVKRTPLSYARSRKATLAVRDKYFDEVIPAAFELWKDVYRKTYGRDPTEVSFEEIDPGIIYTMDEVAAELSEKADVLMSGDELKEFNREKKRAVAQDATDGKAAHHTTIALTTCVDGTAKQTKETATLLRPL